MQTTIEKQKNALLKRFHTLLGRNGIDHEGKMIILDQYSVESSRDLSIEHLIEVCNLLDNQLNPKLAEQDRWRKRLMASVFGWMRKMGKQGNIDLVKGIACRAADVDNFNDIPLERLRSLYYAFAKKSKDLDFVSEVTSAEIDAIIFSN